MNKLDHQIQAALKAASDLPEQIPEPTLSEELLEALNGRHQFLMKWGFIKAVVAASLMLFCIWQFFQQQELMLMIAYATATLLCAVAYSAVANFIWIRMNHNTTIREVKRLELQLALLTQQLQQQSNSSNRQDSP